VKGENPIRACVLEVFGDTPGIDLSRHLAYVAVVSDLRLLDLRGPAAWDAGAVPQLAQTEFPHTSQQWSRFFYETVAVYGEIDGLIYTGAISGTNSVALYERASSKLGPGVSAPLDRYPLYDEILAIRDETGLNIL
jgi:hypothetical protein